MPGSPAIYKAECRLQIAKQVKPDVVAMLGGIHGTVMYPQALTQAPWIDAVLRGEGEPVFLNLVTAVDQGDGARDRHSVRGIACPDRGTEGGKVVATPAEPTIRDLDRIAPDWGFLDWGRDIDIPMGVRVAIPNFARGCPFTCTFCSPWKIKVVDEIEALVRERREAAADVPPGRPGAREPGHRGGHPVVLTIRGNPLCAGVSSPVPVCDFHAATFERLFRVPVHRDTRVCETACEAQGAPACRFELRWR